ncbi:transposase [Burkholderia multivorans]|uniref:transposase n=1 Tax=Burkholderia multivorans TaxID=87883 RepID=UPI001B9574BC|nr:transposase [Burkholderia multivorans]MBR8452030.1 transposase [Burkholderia multivorans]
MMLFDDLRDNEWALVEGLFCSEPARSERRGRPRVEARSVVNAVLWVLSTGEGWSKLPGRYPSPPTCRRRFDEWQADGTLAEIVKRLGTSGRQISLRGHRRKRGEAACTAEPRSTARRVLDQSGIVARAGQNGVTDSDTGGFGRPFSFCLPPCARRTRDAALRTSLGDTSIYYYLQQACTPTLTLATYQRAAPTA